VSDGGAVEVDGFVVAVLVEVLLRVVVDEVVVVVVIVGIVRIGGIVTIVIVGVDEDVEDVVIVDVGSESVGSQSRVIGQRDGRDCATEENTSEAAP
jgi:hypothetical protein